ncbi:MAG: dienelactone hydrolase family protein, partial [Gammaproteobacteria bacterium]
MAIGSRFVAYADGAQALRGYLAVDDAGSGRRPAVLISHAWGGRSPFENSKADWVASLGYVGFALDVYGKGKRGTTKEECSAFMTPLAQDRGLLRRRLLGAVREARSL